MGFQRPVFCGSAAMTIVAGILAITTVGAIKTCDAQNNNGSVTGDKDASASASKQVKLLRHSGRDGGGGNKDLSNLSSSREVIEKLRALKGDTGYTSVTLGGTAYCRDVLEAVVPLRQIDLVIIDSARVDDADVRRLIEARPGIAIVFSQKSVIRRLRSTMPTWIFEDTTLSAPRQVGSVSRSHLVRLLSISRWVIMSAASPPLSLEALDELEYVRSLVGLDLSDAKLSDGDLIKLRNLGDLESLYLWRTPITGCGLQHVPARKLKKLTLSETPFSGDWLARFTQRRYLDVRFTKLSDQNVDSILKLQHLESLYVCGTNLTSTGVQKLGGLPELRYLLIDMKYRGTTVEKSLKMANPELCIEYFGFPRR